MGLLIRLKSPVLEGGTALKSLKYGKDRPGEGDSGQPYVQTPIDQPTSFSDEDTILRGGLKAPSSALKDVSRLTKYFFDNKNPDGLLFIAKQNILSRISTKTEASFGLAYGGFSKDIDLKTGNVSPNQSNGALNAGVYTPLSTLAQAGVGFTGTHLNKQGIDPTGLIPFLSINKYQDVAYANNKSIPEDPKVPLSLVRKSQRASNKAGRKTSKLLNQQLKTQSELDANLQGLNNLPTTSTTGEFSSFQQTSTQKTISAFLEKWDKYLDNQSLKKLKRKETAADKAIDKSTSLYNQVQEAENAPKVYTNRLLKLWNDSGLNLNNAFNSISPTLYSYGGGPDSILGIGKTNINFATTNDGVTPSRTNNVPFEDFTRPEVKYSTINIFGDENSSVSLRWASLFPTSEMNLFGSTDYLETYNNTVLDRLGLPSNFATYSGERLKSQGIQVSPYSTWGQTEFQDTLNYQGQNTTNIDDFRTILTSDYTKTFLGTPYTQNNNIETLFNLGNPGQRGNISEIKQGKVINGVSSALDKITSSPIYKTKVINGYSQEPEFDDIIPFVIGILNNEIQDNTAYVKYMHFRAFINNFSDGYNAEWKGIEYMGRAETFYKYQGFKRDMAVGFTIVAQSRQEQIIMYDKLNFLASSLAPEYLPSGYMTGNLAYLTLGDYISDQPGIINSLDFDISDDSPWETARDRDGSLSNGDDSDVRRLPFMIKVKMKFTPIHKFRPEKEVYKDDTDAKGKFVKDSTKLTKMGGQRFIDPNSPIQTPSPSNIVSQTQEDEDIIVTIDIPEDNEIIDIT
jgi:hypothetical protein